MKTFLIVFNRENNYSGTYQLKASRRLRLTGSEARKKAEWLAKNLGVKEDNLAYTPKVIAGQRIYLAVL